MTEKFYIQGKTYSRDELMSRSSSKQHSELSYFEKGIWDFIRFWLSDELTYSMTSSGSTGTPKEISIPKKWMIASSEASAEVLGLRRGMKAFLCIPSQFMGGIMMIARSLHLGMDLYFEEPSSCPSPPGEMNFSALVPLQYQGLLDSGAQIQDLGLVILGGAPTSPTLKTSCAHHPFPIYATYGMTETVSHVALERLNGDHADGYLHAVPGVRFEVDENQCLCLRITQFDDLEVCTQDLVELKDEQSMIWLGRADHVINSGGLKIHPEQLELKFSPYISQAFFIYRESHPVLGEQVVLYLESEIQVDEHDFLEGLSSYCQKKEVPKKLYILSEFKRTKTGKIQRSATAESK